MAEKAEGVSKSSAEIRLEQLQKWREARGRHHRPGREPLTTGIVQQRANPQPNLAARDTSAKKSAVKRRQKENAGLEDNYLEKFEQWRSEKKKKKEQESASKRPLWRPCSASKTSLLSQPLTRCCNHSHGTRPKTRKRLAMEDNHGNPDLLPQPNILGNQQEPELLIQHEIIQGNQEEAELLLQHDNIQDNQGEPQTLPHPENQQNNQEFEEEPDALQHMEDLDPLNNQELLPRQDDIQGNQDMPEMLPQNNQAEPALLPRMEDLDPLNNPELNQNVGEMEQDSLEDVPIILIEEEEQQGVAQDVPVATVPMATTDVIRSRQDVQVADVDGAEGPATELGAAAPAMPKKVSMRQKLEEWLEEKGKTPSRFRNILTFRTPAPGSARRKLRKRRITAPFRPHWLGLEDAGKEEGDAGKDHVTQQLEAIFRDCMTAADEGYSAANISSILDNVFSSIPQCVQHSHYWLCRARLAQVQGDDHRVVSMFEMAVSAHAEPYEDIKTALTDFVLRKESELSQQPPEHDGIDHDLQDARPASFFKTPTRRSALSRLDQGAAFDSSVKMYSVTPLFRRAHRALRKSAPLPTAKVALIMVTPVRRSTRIHRASMLHPPALREHDPLLQSLADVSEEEFVLRANNVLLADSPNMAVRSPRV